MLDLRSIWNRMSLRLTLGYSSYTAEDYPHTMVNPPTEKLKATYFYVDK